jgi:ubiquinone/menaquinone biosynthesis C-methylase UbiE
MQDPEIVFRELNLKPGDCFLDVGCGPGDYSLRAATAVGGSGTVYALDKWNVMVEELQRRAEEGGLNNLRPMVADILASLPVEDRSIDVCLMATVLHIINRQDDRKVLFEEIYRVLKPEGRLAIIECKKEDQNFGPPKHIRLSAEDIEDFITQYGFQSLGYADLGYNYIVQYGLTPASFG